MRSPYDQELSFLFIEFKFVFVHPVFHVRNTDFSFSRNLAEIFFFFFFNLSGNNREAKQRQTITDKNIGKLHQQHHNTITANTVIMKYFTCHNHYISLSMPERVLQTVVCIFLINKAESVGLSVFLSGGRSVGR